MKRKNLIFAILAINALPVAGFAEELPELSVAKSENCGCCGAWVKHMEDEGFQADAVETSGEALNQLKSKLGITTETASCHTAQVAGYVIEGHVPAEDIQRLLAERPDARGLSVPGMPMGSPGMGDPLDGEGFDVLLIHNDGTTSLWSHHEPGMSV